MLLRTPVIACLLCMAVLAPGLAAADVYKYRDNEGRIYLTDKPMRGSFTLLKRFALPGSTPHAGKRHGADSLAQMQQRRRLLDPLIERAAKSVRIRQELVHAVVRAESAYRRDAVSRKGAVGLMQLMPATAQRFGVTDSYDPAQNLRGGTRYLRFLLDRFDHDLELSLAAYNAGEAAVERYGNRIPPFAETRDYVRKVITFYNAHIRDRRVAQR